ncbi:MAG TPA: hypothetical protein VMT73_01165 [Anaerolineales bacterium]|nr:hypothetical protein [Anaerolineales bacterium]
MTSDPKNNDPRSRMRNILSSSNAESANTRQTEASPLSRLPKAQTPPPPAAPPPTKSTTHTTPPAGPSQYGHLFPAFWTVTGILSLVVNGILLALLLYMASVFYSVQLTAGDAGSNILGGLYTNFEKMDRASIKTTIPVDAQIPLNITVPVQTTTQIKLASNTVISNANVRISTSALNIDAPATVTLPSGTVLDVELNFGLPVQNQIPIHLDVPVNIPLSKTELHEPFVGLQDVVKPLYCLVEPNALNLDSVAICH